MESALVHLVKRSSSPVPWPYHAPTWYDGRIDAGKNYDWTCYCGAGSEYDGGIYDVFLIRWGGLGIMGVSVVPGFAEDEV